MSPPPRIPDQAPRAASRFFARPATRVGRRAAALGAIFVVMFLTNSFVLMRLTSEAPWLRVMLVFYGFAMLAAGLASGGAGLMAVTRHHERSWMVWVAMLPALLVAFLLLGEFLIP